MKNTFKGFHNVPQDELEHLWKNDKTLFVFDANVLLNLYGYAKQTRDDFFKILESINEKLWIPYHAGLEYQNKRLSIIRREKVVFNDIEKNLAKIQNIFTNDFKQLELKRRFPKLSERTENLEKSISKSISDYKRSVLHWNKEQPCVRSHDGIREKLNNLFENKVGEKPVDQEWLNNLYKEGAERFKNKVPPGFKDTDKANKNNNTHFFYDGLNYERQYGDLIVWKQIIEKAKDDNVENIIFITDDAKDDWWYTIDSNGKKSVGPLAQLQAEIYSESKIASFQMYSTSSFMKDGESFMAVEVKESSIADAQTSHTIPIKQSPGDYWLKYYKKFVTPAHTVPSEELKNSLWKYINHQDHLPIDAKSSLYKQALIQAIDEKLQNIHDAIVKSQNPYYSLEYEDTIKALKLYKEKLMNDEEDDKDGKDGKDDDNYSLR